MKIKITMINEDVFCLNNSEYKTLKDFINNQVVLKYYILSHKHDIAIRCENILKIDDLEKLMPKILKKRF